MTKEQKLEVVLNRVFDCSAQAIARDVVVHIAPHELIADAELSTDWENDRMETKADQAYHELYDRITDMLRFGKARGVSMQRETDSVIDHYTRNDLMERIRTALKSRGYDPDNPSIEMLSELDHLHGGGFATTEAQIELAEIPRGCHALDAGCGIGGPSRYLAGVHGCSVDGIDLTPEYIDVAGQLNAMTGLDRKISLTVGSVTDLPYEDERFDVVLCQNVSMNVADKDRMFKEAFRVLKPKGIYTLSHLAEGPNGPPIYPLPWALTADASFLGTPQDLLETLSWAGFADIEDRAGRARSKPGGGPQPGTIGAAPAMGDDMPVRTGNAAQSAQEGRLVSMMVVARRPDD